MPYYIKFVDKNPNRKIKIKNLKFISGKITAVNDINLVKVLTKRKDMILISNEDFAEEQRKILIEKQKQAKIDLVKRKRAEEHDKQTLEKKLKNNEKKKDFNQNLRTALQTKPNIVPKNPPQMPKKQDTLNKIKNKLKKGKN